MRLKVLESITDVSAAEWQGLVGPSPVPTLRREWLAAMEESGSASQSTGWVPSHLTLWRDGNLVGAAPAYEKHHSMGEYIYDFSWAHAAQQLGVRYHPKLLVGAPLSPLTAPRLLVAPGEDAAVVSAKLAEAIVELARERGYSSAHVLFPSPADADLLEARGFARRASMQFHWKNAGYRTYDDFLARFTSKRRHQLRRERAAASEQGILIRTVRGDALTAAHGELAFRLYEATNSKNSWGNMQLNREFFRRVFASMQDVVEVVEAVRGERVVAGAFNLAANDRLYGRYWGCFEEVPFLHFNVCMYYSIDECIRLGRKVFEPGAGGEHKIARGFEPTVIHSNHFIFDKKLDSAIRRFLVAERAEISDVCARSEEISGLRPSATVPAR